MAISDIFHSNAQVVGLFVGLFLCCIIHKMTFLGFSTLQIWKVPTKVRTPWNFQKKSLCGFSFEDNIKFE